MLAHPIITVLVAVTSAAPTPVQEGSLDLVPHDATIALSVRNLGDFLKKADALVKEFDPPGGMGMSDMLDQALTFIGLKPVIDADGPAAVALVNRKVIGEDIGLQNLDKYLAVALTYRNRESVEKFLGLGAQEVKPDTVLKAKGERQWGHYGYIKGRIFYLANEEKTLLAMVKAKPLSGELTPERRQTFSKSDLLVLVGTEAWGKGWLDFQEELKRAIGEQSDDADRKAADDFLKAVAGMRFVVGGVRLDGGLGFNVLGVFNPEHDAAKKFLTQLRGGDGAASLHGLPMGNVIGLTAARGDGTQNNSIARLFLSVMLHNFLETRKFTAPTDRSTFIGVFTEIWQRLHGSRFALYKTSDELKYGLFSLVAILDTEDPELFLKDLQMLAKFGSGDGLDLTSEAGKEANLADVKKLLQDLADRRFRVRESATVKLKLIGEPVLPHLDEAIKGTDREASKRAERIRDEIVSAAEARRKELLDRQFAHILKPSFAFLPKGETREGKEVRMIGVKLRKEDAAYGPQLKQFFGPDWNRIRVAVHEKQIVLMVGSETKLFDEAIKNLKGNLPGLAKAPMLKDFSERSDVGRKLEFHIALAKVTALVNATDISKPEQFKPDAPVSSIALTVDPDRLQIDAFLPISEIKAMVKAGRSKE